jgi:predicted DNA helicase
MHPILTELIRAVDLEEKEQQQRYRLDEQHTLKFLKAEGLALHPLQVNGKGFGYADYPEIRFRLPFPAETSQFRDGSAIECFFPGEEPVKGLLLNMEGRQGSFRMFAPDFPDWIEEQGVGIKLAPDTRTTDVMKQCLLNLESNKSLFRNFQALHGELPSIHINRADQKIQDFHHQELNESQQRSIESIISNEGILIIHGPPGTGKTTTLTEAVRQLTREGKKILVSAPSNTAVDNLSTGLVRAGVRVLRVGNTLKTDPLLMPHTLEGQLTADGRELKEIKELKKRAEAFRRMALKYKRSFGKDEREQRRLLFQEVKNIRQEIRKLKQYQEEKLFADAHVIAGTPIGLYDAGLDKFSFDTVFLDEAGQCLEPLAWVVFRMAEKIVMAGDPYQLPPTVLSWEAVQRGLQKSVLETAMQHIPAIHLLDTQYRMRHSIAGFSNAYFYQDALKTAAQLENKGVHIYFIDTAGTGMEEKQGTDGTSLQNEGELNVVQRLLELEAIVPERSAFISPYAGQVSCAKDRLPGSIRIRTIDSFQGQEADTVIISLVRSNDGGEIGFLKDYRRMNVAMTRAREQLFIVGDGATIGQDRFYGALMDYIEAHGLHKSAWEYLG